jgi:hypothetical protein
VALVMVEATAVTRDCRITPGNMGIWGEEHVEPLARIVRFAQSQGAIAGIQLAHAGRKAGCDLPWKGGARLRTSEDGCLPVVASAASPRPWPARQHPARGGRQHGVVPSFGRGRADNADQILSVRAIDPQDGHADRTSKDGNAGPPAAALEALAGFLRGRIAGVRHGGVLTGSVERSPLQDHRNSEPKMCQAECDARGKENPEKPVGHGLPRSEAMIRPSRGAYRRASLPAA